MNPANSNFIAEQISFQANQQPSDIALVSNDVQLSYREMQCQAEAIAAFIHVNATKSDFVMIWDDGRMDAHLAVLGALFAGKTYVPISHALPLAQINMIIDKVGAKFCLGGPILAKDRERLKDVTYYNIQEIASGKSYRSAHLKYPYLLFTSGTTGTPKGIRINSLNLASLFQFFANDKHSAFNRQDRFLQSFALSFDVSVFTFLFPLTIGATVIISRMAQLKYVGILNDIQELEPTVVTLAPSFCDYITPYQEELNFESLRLTIFTADRLLGRHVNSWKLMSPNSAIYNFYGPTESTIFTSRYKVDRNFQEDEGVPIGKPIGLQQFEVDSKGELIIKGPQVFEGYFRDNKPGVFNDSGGYKSGDLVHLDDRGNYRFKGRLDDQVKIDGYRIELDEVNEVVRKVIGEKAITITVEKAGMSYLVCFVEAKEVNKHFLRKELACLLPLYKIPKKIIPIGKFPVNRNGKIDREKLSQVLVNE